MKTQLHGTVAFNISKGALTHTSLIVINLISIKICYICDTALYVEIRKAVCTQQRREVMSGVGQVMSGVSHLQSKVMSGVVTHLGQVLNCDGTLHRPVMTL